MTVYYYTQYQMPGYYQIPVCARAAAPTHSA
jgi:hypothetical protein